MPADPNRPLVIIHGWSDDAQGMAPLSQILEAELGKPVSVVHLARWISMDDEVNYRDVVTR